jgi:hypothetical protein
MNKIPSMPLLSKQRILWHSRLISVVGVVLHYARLCACMTACTQTLVPELALLQHEVTELRERAGLLSEQMHTAVLSAHCSSLSCTSSSSNSGNNYSNGSNGSSSNGSSSSSTNSSSATATASNSVKGAPGLCQQCEHLRSDMSRYKAKLDEVRSWALFRLLTSVHCVLQALAICMCTVKFQSSATDSNVTTHTTT